MKPTHIRAFEIEGVRFHLTERGDGHMQVTSVHPYDETEYHWAVQASESLWYIYRCRRCCAGYGSRSGPAVTPEDIATALLKMDAEAHLTPMTAIW